MVDYPSLTALTQASELVVVGHVVGITRGRDIEVDSTSHEQGYFATLSVQLDEQVRGRAILNKEGLLNLEIFLETGPPNQPPTLAYGRMAASIPDGTAMLFLTSVEGWYNTVGVPVDPRRAGRDYYQIVSAQGVFQDADGTVRTLGLSDWSAAFEKTTFMTLLERVRGIEPG